ncbi:MAG: metal ABC transporter substrate-binding protein [Longimicrobiales bacterium]|nr:metal ABC transporter substrate-binding protein [Longimicrobiales bacterium]
MKTTALLLTGALTLAPGATPDTASPGADDQDVTRVVATLPVYAEIAKAVGGDRVTVDAIADPREDAHFVRPKPSFALRIRRADVFITTGLDLELWVPALLDKAGNAEVMEGGRGYVTAYTGIELLDIPEAADRSEGDIHIYGNPHIFTDPLNMIIVAENIATGLERVAPEHAAVFDANVAAFAERIHRGLYGDRLVELLEGPTLARLDEQGELFGFLRDQEYEGTPLIDRLGGWHAAAAPFRGEEVICYHKNWAYFEDRFGVTCADYVEAKPGIPPTPGHVGNLIRLMRDQGIDVLLAANYFDGSQVRAVARRAGATSVIVPLQPGGSPEAGTYFDTVDVWIESLAAAFRGS